MDIDLSTILVLLIGLCVIALLYSLIQKINNLQSKNDVITDTTTVVPVTETPLPYWTAYGLPEYWPSYLSPYWYYDVPYYGPITGTSGYYPSRHQWSGGRANYMPHGWGRTPIGGASGVAVGGGGH